MIKAGKYNKLITLQARDFEREKQHNQYGAGTPIWADVVTVRASVEPIQGREYFSGPFQLGEDIIRVRLRYLPNITRKMRVKYGDRYLEINSVIDSKEEHRELQLMCKEGEAYGKR
ncbi:phage head-tail adapter protein [Caviibacterium pharyngocola]|uniref:Phage head-tail adapter protein n=2 Tax=Caviibacterium pharyngocola TaxID=28159 RepID=A0A2M8RSU5_9PAST|nr:phage head-tail adapter protein [Caviibacterium pharyngocola]